MARFTNSRRGTLPGARAHRVRRNVQRIVTPLIADHLRTQANRPLARLGRVGRRLGSQLLARAQAAYPQARQAVVNHGLGVAANLAQQVLFPGSAPVLPYIRMAGGIWANRHRPLALMSDVLQGYIWGRGAHLLGRTIANCLPDTAVDFINQAHHAIHPELPVNHHHHGHDDPQRDLLQPWREYCGTFGHEVSSHIASNSHMTPEAAMVQMYQDDPGLMQQIQDGFAQIGQTLSSCSNRTFPHIN